MSHSHSDRMIQLGYHINNYEDFITWATHSFGPDLVLFLIFYGLLFLLHLIYSILSFFDRTVQRTYKCLCKVAKSWETSLSTRFSSRPSRRPTIRSANLPGSPRSSRTPLRCYDRPNCPLSPPLPFDESLTLSTSPITSRSPSADHTTTPSTPLAPLAAISRRNPLRRRSSLP